MPAQARSKRKPSPGGRSVKTPGRRAQVRRVGGSYVVTLPRDLCDQLHIDVGTAIDFQLQGKQAILLQPQVKPRSPRLRPRRPIKDLLKQGTLNREIPGWDADKPGKGELI